MDFFRNIFWSPVSRIVPKNVKGGPWEVFEYPFFCKIEKIEGETLWRHFKKCEKKSHKAGKNLHKKFFFKPSNPRPSKKPN